MEFSQSKGTSIVRDAPHLVFYGQHLRPGPVTVRSPSIAQSCSANVYCPSISRLSVQRLRILQQKKEAQAKSSRRDIASLLERGKLETAKVKVENSTFQCTIVNIF